jgi:glycosyltransferase involved in cell wall biosynthesis
MNDSNANRGRFPFKLTQYMLYQKPIIASPVGDIPRIYEKGDIGELVPSLPEEYAEATFKLFKDDSLAKIKGQNAKRIVEKNFLWKQLADELERFYFEKLS